MEKNIFENAKFGDMYWTAPEPNNEFPTGRPAIFTRLAEDNATHEVWAILYLYSGFCEINCTLDGKYFDWVGGEKKFWDDIPNPFIVGKRPINTEQMDKDVAEYDDSRTKLYWVDDKTGEQVCNSYEVINAYKAGYKKALGTGVDYGEINQVY